MKIRKGQINFEFLASAALYLIALGAIITSGTDILPKYQDEAERAGLNLEARSLTNSMITEPGEHTFRSGGTNWEKNSSTVRNVEEIGLGKDFLELERSKITSLSTVGGPDGGTLNYTTFKQVTDADNQYRFRFTWKPTVDANRSFLKGSPPAEPSITEPDSSLYQKADNEIHYGEVELRGVKYYFLLTAHDGIYNTTYFTRQPDDWDFSSSAPMGTGDVFTSFEWEVDSFQNRPEDRGSLLVLSKQINEFGASIDSEATVVNMNRYAVMEGEPLNMEVWVW